MTTKKCSKCGQTKDISEFYEQKHNSITKEDGIITWIGPRYQARCKECNSKINKKRRDNNPDRYKKQGIEYRKKNRDKIIEYRKKTMEERRTKSGYYIRSGLKYVFDSSIENLKKCSVCGEYRPRDNFRRESNRCKPCLSHIRKEKYVPRSRKPRKRRTPEEIRTYDRNYMRTYNYLIGDGCCLYCGETNPFMLNNHHIFGRKSSDFTITLCENHHAAFTRRLPFVLEEWYAPTTDNQN